MKNVLIVDDEKFVRLGIRTLLERSNMFSGEIVECKNGKEALETLRERSFDIIFSDIKMPLMDGIEFISTAKKENLTNAKIVVISGYDDFNYAVQVMKNGACEYLLKPIDREAFYGVLEKLDLDIENSTLEGVSIVSDFDEYENKVQKINRAVEFIKTNYNQNINMAVVSNEVSMNYTFFSESFKEIKGQSFVDYLKSVRISMAKQLLRTSCLQVSRISNNVGFNDEKHFLKTFKAEVGCTPSEYRKKYVNEY